MERPHRRVKQKSKSEEWCGAGWEKELVRRVANRREHERTCG